ncbi:MAG: hypothetical protein K2X38_20055 [Gemmataceae bacterium]|nr:hypothetical protein [Gemmataceae bacterium]
MTLARTQQQQGRQSQSQPPRLRATLELAIVSIGGVPSNNADVIDIRGESMVRVVAKTTSDVGSNMVLAAIGGSAYPNDAVFANGISTRLRFIQQNANGYFYAGWAPLARLALNGPQGNNPNNNFLRVVVYDNAGTVIESVPHEFYARIANAGNSLSAVVQATNAAWFAFANHDFPPPNHTMTYGEADSVVTPRTNHPDPTAETGDRCVYRPQYYVVPDGADAAAADALTIVPPDESQIWRHGPPNTGCDGNYRGRANTSTSLDAGKRAEYQSARLNSDVISDDACDLISLIFMWRPGTSGANSALKQLSRQTSTSQPVPTDAKMIFFAAHDSFEWSNNLEAVAFTLTWKAAP